jgi:hypothetical protein
MLQKNFRNVTFEMLTDNKPNTSLTDWASFFGKLVKDAQE